jgi:hypothetical protein
MDTSNEQPDDADWWLELVRAYLYWIQQGTKPEGYPINRGEPPLDKTGS